MWTDVIMLQNLVSMTTKKWNNFRSNSISVTWADYGSQTLIEANSTPYHNTRSAPYHNTRSAPYHNTRSAPYHNTRSAPYHNTRSAPYHNTRSNPTSHQLCATYAYVCFGDQCKIGFHRRGELYTNVYDANLRESGPTGVDLGGDVVSEWVLLLDACFQGFFP